MGVKFTPQQWEKYYMDLEHLTIRCDKCNDLVFGLYRTLEYSAPFKWREYYLSCIKSSLDMKIFHFSLEGQTYCRRCYSHYQPDRQPEKPFMDIVREELKKLEASNWIEKTEKSYGY